MPCQDTTSSCIWCGKRVAWGAWGLVPGLTETLLTIQSDPSQFTIDSEHMERLERFYVLHYSKTCGQSRVNKARVYLFNTGARLLDRMPPSQADIYQHIQRSLLQAGSKLLFSSQFSLHSLIGAGKEAQLTI